MKIELFVSVNLIGVGIIIGAGVVSDGSWLEIADKLASLISCIVTCIAFFFAWKAYHSWKSPLILNSYETFIEQLELCRRNIFQASIMFLIPKSFSEPGPGVIYGGVTNKYLKAHSESALKAIRHITDGFPTADLLKVQSIDALTYNDIIEFRDFSYTVRQKISAVLNLAQEESNLDLDKNLNTSTEMGELISKLIERIDDLTNTLKRAHGRIL